MNWYLEVLKKYAVFSGRSRRKEYWYFALFYLLIFIALGVVDSVVGFFSIEAGIGILGREVLVAPLVLVGAIFALLMFIPSLAVGVRRLHDTDRSGWWLLIALIPLGGAIVLLVFLVQDSEPGENQYGSNPKQLPEPIAAALVEQWVFGRRKLMLVIFLLATVVLFGFATQTRIDAGFEKQLPHGHPYIKTFTKYQSQFGGANRVMVALMAREGDIFTPEYFKKLEAVTQAMYAMPGVDQSSVTSLFTPNVRFTEVVEDGFTGGNVVPADFPVGKDNPTHEDLARVRENVLKSNYMGRLVTDSFNGAMVMANLLDIDPDTRERLDYFAVARRLEALRAEHASPGVGVHIIGFAKIMGDIRDGALNVVTFFGITVLLTALLVWLYAQSFWFAALPLGCSIAAVAWQLGLLNLLGYGIDPMSILVPFLIFAIGVSHGVQMVRAFRAELFAGSDPLKSARAAFRQLLVPGGVALITDTIGFVTILLIPVPTIRELAIAASIGVAVIILTNLLLLPLLLSYQKPREGYREGVARRKVWTIKI